MGGRASRAQKMRQDVFTVVAHWGVVCAVLVSLGTGLAIAVDSGASPALWPALLLRWLQPSGALVDWHLASGAVITLLVTSYSLYQVTSGAGRRFLWWRQQSRLSERWSAAGLGSTAEQQRRRSLLLWALFAALSALVITGLALVIPGRAAWSGMLGGLHGLLAVVLMVVAGLHAVHEVGLGRLGKMLRVRARGWKLGAVLALVSAVTLGGGVLIAAQPSRLMVEPVAVPPRLDGLQDDAAWAKAAPVSVVTNRGANFNDGATRVTLRAVNDGTFIYFLVTWDDATESRHHLPLVKTEKGWQLQHTGFIDDDENVYYEDKLALLFSTAPALGSATAHFGDGLVAGPHRPETRGLHFSDGAVFDLWHWKSLRTGAQRPSSVDDNHIGPPQPSVQPEMRYTGGYQPDWGGSGYHLNLCLADDPDCRAAVSVSRATGEYHPPAGSQEARFRRCVALGVACEQRLIPLLIPNTSGDGSGVVRPGHDRLYDATVDKVEPGTRVPGVVIYNRLSDDRSDIQGSAHWQQGQWTLEIRRALTTGSKYDVQFNRRSPIYLWVAAFDHSQTRHTRHLIPIELRLN